MIFYKHTDDMEYFEETVIASADHKQACGWDMSQYDLTGMIEILPTTCQHTNTLKRKTMKTSIPWHSHSQEREIINIIYGKPKHTGLYLHYNSKYLESTKQANSNQTPEEKTRKLQ